MRIQCAIKLSFYYVNNICTVQLTRVQTDMGFVCELLWLIRLKMPINDEVRNDAHIASTCVRLY